MTDFECTCSVVKGERDSAWGEDCYCWYPKPNYTECIVRCRDCKHYFNDPDDIYYAYQVPVCMYFADGDGFNAACVKPDGFCAWGVRRDD